MPSPPHRSQILLLGPCTVEVDGVRLDLTQWPAKAATLLRLLAVVQEHRLTRDQAIELLWPEVEPEAGISNLKGIVYRLRRVLGEAVPPPIVLEHGWVLLNPACGFQIDADRLQALAEHAGEDVALLEEAAPLFRGEPLPEDRYEDWAAPAREYLQRRWREVCLRLIALYEERGEGDRGLRWARRLLEADPLDEEAVQHVLRLTVALGRRTEARRLFQAFEGRLRTELGVGPSAETRAIVTPPGNLPSSVSTFVGRKDELTAIGTLLLQEEVRLVTLTGPGGVGKTRLALEAARERLDPFADGIYLVSLAPLRDPALVPSSIAHVLGVREASTRPVEEALAEAIGQRELLLILDNLEHLLPATPLITDLLAACPALTVLATSRVMLQLTGEHVYPVPPLALPDPDMAGDEAGWTSDATALFLQRARSVRPGLRSDGATDRLVAAICRRLEGIPLAIELAAARVSALSLPQIASGLDDALHLLTGGNRGADSRQRTLRATLDWSYDLLGEAERTLFRRLSVFAGGWTLEAAGTIGTEEGAESAEVLDLLSHLVDQSLVLAQGQPDGTMRYRMLEPIRQYAARRLAESGERDRVSRQHAALFLAIAEAAHRELLGEQSGAWLERLATEHDNLLAALQWCDSSGGDRAMGLRLAAKLAEFWCARGDLREGRHWLELMLDGDASGNSADRAEALQGASNLAYWQHDYDRVMAWGEEGLALYRRLGDGRGAGFCLVMLGLATMERGDMHGAGDFFEQARDLFGEVDDRLAAAMALCNIGVVAQELDDPVRAREAYEESLTIFRKAGDQVNTAAALANVAAVSRNLGDVARALACFREALVINHELKLQRQLIYCLEGIGFTFSERGEADRAARLLGAAEALRETGGHPPEAHLVSAYAPRVARVREALGEDRMGALLAEGRGLSLEDAIALAHEEP